MSGSPSPFAMSIGNDPEETLANLAPKFAPGAKPSCKKFLYLGYEPPTFSGGAPPKLFTFSCK